MAGQQVLWGPDKMYSNWRFKLKLVFISTRAHLACQSQITAEATTTQKKNLFFNLPTFPPKPSVTHTIFQVISTQVFNTQIENAHENSWVETYTKECVFSKHAWLKCKVKLTVSAQRASQPFASGVVLHSDDLHALSLSYAEVQFSSSLPVMTDSGCVKNLHLTL